MLPSRMVSTRSVIAASASLWVIITKVWPRSVRRRRNSSCMLCALALSRLPVGSSANTTDGLVTSARAMATLCCSPPDSSVGLLVRRCPRPTTCSISVAAMAASFFDLPAIHSGIHTFSNALNSGSR